MSVSGHTPPRASVNTPSTETSSGSLVTHEPAAQRMKLERAAAASSSVPCTSIAGLVVDYRRSSREEEAAGCGASGGLAYPAPGATTDLDDLQNCDSEAEAVGSSSTSSATSWRPRSRSETLQGPGFEDFQRQQTSGFPTGGPSVPGHHPAGGERFASAGDRPSSGSRAGSVAGPVSPRCLDPKELLKRYRED